MLVNYLEKLPDSLKTSALDLYLDSFQDKLLPVLGDAARAHEVLGKNINTTHCLAAVCDQRLVGILAIKNIKGSFLNPTLRTMIRAYGLPGGIFRLWGLALLDHSTALDELYVDGIAVVDRMRGRGIGSGLLDMLEKTALKKEIKKISLEVIDTNQRAETLYRRIGFEVTKQRTIWPLNWFIQFPFNYTRLMVKILY